jgi:N-acetylmuramoyl-L-alanine amidase
MYMKPNDYHFTLPKKDFPTNITIPEVWYPRIKTYWDRCTSNRIFHSINGVRAIVIHATAGSSSAGAVSVMRDGRASFHWLIPDEDEPQHGEVIWACAPEALAAWHVRNSASHPKVNGGARKVNHWSLGIELVNTQKSSDGFSDWQVEMTVQLVKYCWAKYPNLKHVLSHAVLDPNRRSDPGTLFPWQDFKKRVLSANVAEMLVFQNAVKSAPPADRLPKSITDEGACVM